MFILACCCCFGFLLAGFFTVAAAPEVLLPTVFDASELRSDFNGKVMRASERGGGVSDGVGESGMFLWGGLVRFGLVLVGLVRLG